MARGRLTTAVVALLVLVSLVASATSEKPECCRDYRQWGNELENKGCPVPEKSDADCNAWCMQAACSRNGADGHGFCKLIGNLHYCHCKC